MAIDARPQIEGDGAFLGVIFFRDRTNNVFEDFEFGWMPGRHIGFVKKVPGQIP
jgi:hypothetical protein